MIFKEKIRTGMTTASSLAEAKSVYSVPPARNTDARGHNKSGPRYYELRRQTDPDKSGTTKGMKITGAHMKGQTPLVVIRRTKDSGVLAIEENDIEIITAVTGTAIATRTMKNGTQEMLAGTAMTIADTMMAKEIDLMTEAIAKIEKII